MCPAASIAFAPVCAARAVFGRDVRPLHVDAGEGGLGRRRDGPRARGEAVERRRDEGGEKQRDARATHGLRGGGHLLGGDARVVEVDAGKPVDLQIHEPGTGQRPRAGLPGRASGEGYRLEVGYWSVEPPELFLDGFETGDADRWSATLPTD